MQIFVALLFLVSLSAGADTSPCQEIEQFFKTELTAFQDKIDKASAAYQIEQWKVEAHEKGASPEKMGALFDAYQKTAYNEELLKKTQALSAKVKKIKKTSCPWIPRLARVLQILETGILTQPSAIKKEKANQDQQDQLASKSNAFRIETPEKLSRALLSKKIGSTEDRKKREELFKKFNASRAKAWLEWGFRDLVKARNEEAHLAGFKNYYEYRFVRNQLSLGNYLKNVRKVKQKLVPQAKKLLSQLAREQGISQIEAWDLRFLREKAASGKINELFKEFPEDQVMNVARAFYSKLGIDIDSYHFKTDLYPRPGKNTHAFAMGVVAPHVDEKGKVLSSPQPDIRFLANLKKPVQWGDISTIIHELGHAVHFGEIRQPIAIFRGFGSVETEAIAMTLERMSDSKEFLKQALPQFTQAKEKDLDSLLNEQERSTKIEQVFVLLRQVLFSEFEYSFYQNPDQDLAKSWAQLYQEYWGVKLEPQYADWDIDHFVMAPVYVQNYAIGLLMVQQFYDALIKDFGAPCCDIKMGNWLRKNYFAPGLEFDYLALTQKLSGAPLDAGPALQLLKGIL